MRKFFLTALLLFAIGGLVFWIITSPDKLTPEQLAALPDGDAAAGEHVFFAGGCASCHAAPGAKGDEKLALAGGEKFTTQFGTFIAPNISSDPKAGIGNWTLGQFANAVLKGVSPSGEHYYPAFPYASYRHMTNKDLADLFTFMKTLPPVSVEAPPHEVSFPFNIRRLLGGWKWLFLRDGHAVELAADSDAQVLRGQYLVEALGHCGECHTPRNALGGLDQSNWLKGGPAPEGEGRIPDISPSGLGNWSASDIAYYLESGFTPEYDSVGGSMVAVQENMAKLPASDREAIAAYLKALPQSRQQSPDSSASDTY